MTGFVEGGGEKYLRELRAAHREIVAQLRSRLKAATTLAEREEVEQALAAAKREHAEQTKTARRAMFFDS